MKEPTILSLSNVILLFFWATHCVVFCQPTGLGYWQDACSTELVLLTKSLMGTSSGKIALFFSPLFKEVIYSLLDVVVCAHTHIEETP